MVRREAFVPEFSSITFFDTDNVSCGEAWTVTVKEREAEPPSSSDIRAVAVYVPGVV